MKNSSPSSIGILDSSILALLNVYSATHLFRCPASELEAELTDGEDMEDIVSEAGGVYKLKVAALTMEDAGEYGVEFTNRAGDKKMTAELKVHCKYR